MRSFQADAKLHSFQEPIQADLDRMQTVLRDFFNSRVPLIHEVGDHLLTMAGKRFRPALTLLIARLGGERARDPVFAAAVIELIHTATLVHDDTIDKSALRRGLPTINALYNDLVATILGDYIYTKAMVDLFEGGEDGIVRIVARTTYEMSIGEMLQIQQKRNVDASGGGLPGARRRENRLADGRLVRSRRDRRRLLARRSRGVASLRNGYRTGLPNHGRCL